jgi:hypothetical protein
MGVDVNHGASQIAQLLQQGQPEAETPTQPSDSEPETAESPEEAQQEPEVEEIAEETDEVSEHQEQDTEYEESEETPEVETSESDTEPEPTYKVKVNGEEREVPLDELKKGYMMESDYRKKTSEVARQRDEFSKEKAAFAEKVKQAEELLIVEAEDLNSEENLELKEYDPQEYYKKKEKLEAKANRLAEMKKEAQEFQQQQSMQRLEKEKELLFQAVPEWLDEGTQTQETKLINDMLVGMGIEGDALRPFIDHRLLVIARKAAMYDKLKSAKPETKKVQVKPKNVKAGNVKTKEEISRSKVQEQRSRLKKTGKMSDAQAAIKKLMR